MRLVLYGFRICPFVEVEQNKITSCVDRSIEFLVNLHSFFVRVTASKLGAAKGTEIIAEVIEALN